jgi:hypothetical protein
MARISGVGGNCTVNGYSIQFRDWSAQFTNTDIDVTGFTDTYTKHVSGVQGGTFSASGTMNAGGGGPHPGDGGSVDLGTLAAVVLTAATSCTYTNTALITSVDVAVAVAGEATASVSGVFDGAVTMAWVD